MESVLSATNVFYGRLQTRDQDHGPRALMSDLSLELPPGHILGLFGKNGSGKSTLLKMFGGRLNPQSGIIQVCGLNPQTDRTAIGSQLGCFLGERLSQSLAFTFASCCRHIPGFHHQRTIDAFGDRFPDTSQSLQDISDGEYALFIFALILGMPNLKCLVLDEPVKHLDIVQRRWMMQQLVRMRNDGISTLLVGHEYTDIARIADQTQLLHNGRLLKLNASTKQVSTKYIVKTTTASIPPSSFGIEQSGEHTIFYLLAGDNDTVNPDDIVSRSDVNLEETLHLLCSEPERE